MQRRVCFCTQVQVKCKLNEVDAFSIHRWVLVMCVLLFACMSRLFLVLVSKYTIVATAVTLNDNICF